MNNIDVNGDSLLLNKTSVAEAMLAIYNGLEDGTNIKMKFNNGVLDPTSIEAHAKVTSDFFCKICMRLRRMKRWLSYLCPIKILLL